MSKISRMNKLSRRILKNHVAISSRGNKTKVTYFSPSHPNDIKRIGKQLTIKVGNASITLDGTGIRSLEKVLDDVYCAERA